MICYNFIPKNNKKLIIFIHGFLGSSKCYNFLLEEIDYDVLLIDLPGHGKSPISKKDSFFNVTKKIFNIINNYSHKNKILIGYSMGGRFCLQLLNDYPNAFNGLVLESVGVGLSNFFEKSKRKQWQKQIIKNSFKDNLDLSKFLKFWYYQKLFSSLRNKKNIFSKMIFEKQKSISIKKVLIAFENFSPIHHINFYRLLLKISSNFKQSLNIFYLAGDQDIKYKNLFLKIKKHCKIYGVVFKGVGHNIKLEAPFLYKKAIINFLEKT